jgi:hypothetical protein
MTRMSLTKWTQTSERKELEERIQTILENPLNDVE